MSSRSIWLVIGGLTLLAAILRVIGLNSGLWFDEITTLVEFARKPLPEILGQYSKNNHPLYSVLAHVALESLGEHPWSLRVPAVVFGVACIPMLYVLGTAVTSQLEALLAAALLAVSYHHIWFSQNARGYTASAFWALLSTFLLLKSLRDHRLGCSVGYGAVAALSVYTHLSMGFVVVAHLLSCVWLLARHADGARLVNWRLLTIGFPLAAILSLLLYSPMLLEMSQVFSQPSPLREIATPRWASREILGGFRVGLGVGGALAGLLLFATGLWGYLHRSRLVFTLFLLPGLLTAAGVLVLRLPMQPRFFFSQIGFGALVVVRGAMLGSGWVTRNWRVSAARRLHATTLGAILVGVLILANGAHLDYLYRYPKQDYEGALRFVEAARAPGETIVTAGLAVKPYRHYYDRAWEDVQSRDELQKVRSQPGRVWLLYTLPAYTEPDLMALIQQECPPVKVFRGTLAGGDVVVCALQPTDKKLQSLAR